MENPFAKESFRNIPEEGLTEIYHNPRMKLPFDPKDLALFLDRKSGNVALRGLPYHHRSADLGVSTIIREDDAKRHNVYCQFDIKGGGFLFPELHESKKVGLKAGELAGFPEAHLYADSPETQWGYDALGLFDERLASTAVQRANQLSAAGMRTEGIIGILLTDRVYLNSKEVPVKEFKREAIGRMRELAKDATNNDEKARYREMAKDIRDQFNPVIMIRAIRSVFRLRDFKDAAPEQKQTMLEEACQNVNYEQEALGSTQHFEVKTSEGLEAFLEFISGWYGKNVGIMHSAGFIHEFLHMGNLTLAGEIVDLDSVQPMLKQVKFRGKPENRIKWIAEQSIDKPSFHETEDGYVYVNPDVGAHRNLDARFGLPKCLIKDMRDLCFSMRMIIKDNWPDKHIRKQIAQQIIEGYGAGLGEHSPFSSIGISTERLLEVFTEIANEIVRDGRKMDPIEPDKDVESST